jgi:hypothetical protein
MSKMKQISENDLVIYHEVNDHVVHFALTDTIIIYNDKNEAQSDCLGNEKVVRAIDLPQNWVNKIKNQINKS